MLPLHHLFPTALRGRRAPRRARVLTAFGLATVAMALLSADVLASRGYSGYQMTFSSSDPAGYTAAPGLTAASSSVQYQFQVTNQGMFGSNLTATVYVERLTSYTASPNSTPVYIGNPRFASVDEETLLDASSVTGTAPSSQDLQPQGQMIPGNMLVGSSQPVQYTESVPVGSCGYYAIWIGDSGAAQASTFNPAYLPSSQSASFLNAGVVRVTQGCPTRPTPTPTPAPHHPTGGHSAKATPSPTPSPKSGTLGAASTPAVPGSGVIGYGGAPTLPITSTDKGSNPPDGNIYPLTQAAAINPGVALVFAVVLAAALTVAMVVFLRERIRVRRSLSGQGGAPR